MRGVLMKKKVFEGCATALVTPFSGGAVDYGSFEALVERQLDAGVSALVFAGTTGEAPTLTAREWEEICAFAVGTFGGRVPVIVGCGSNSTAEAARKAGRAEELGADAALVVTPYYNKGNAEDMSEGNYLNNIGHPCVAFPFGYRLNRYSELSRELRLRNVAVRPECFYSLTYCCHIASPYKFVLVCRSYAFIIPNSSGKEKQFIVEKNSICRLTVFYMKRQGTVPCLTKIL